MDTVMTRASTPLLDPREKHFRVPSPHDGLSLFLRYLPPVGAGCSIRSARRRGAMGG